MDDQQFIQLLESLLQPDTETVKSATSSLNRNYYTSPQSLVALIQILTTHPKIELRQLAAIESRKLVSKHWNAVPAEQRSQIRDHVLQSTLKEENTLVRHSAARVISAIAKIDLEDGQWADLPSLLQQAATSSTAQHREVGVYVLFTLLETMNDIFSDNLGDLFSVFNKTIKDPESADVRVNTMLALAQVGLIIDTEEDEASIANFQALVPDMVNVLKGAIDESDERHAAQAFEVFQTLLACDPSLLSKHFKDLLEFMLELASQTSVEEDMRTQGLSFLMQCVRYRKLKVQGLKVGEQMTIKSLQIVTELGDLVDEDEVTPARSALGLLDILASSLPPNQVIVPLLKTMGAYVNSQDPTYRRAGILALGMTVEGAPDFIATQLHEILPLVLRLLEDPDNRVRAAALQGVARLADDLAEDLGKEHARLIPALVTNFDMASQDSTGATEANLEIVRGSCNAIDSLIEGLEKDAAAVYVSELVPRFSPIFQHNDYKAKIAAIGAVGSIAAASMEAFMPYFSDIMQALGQYVPIKESQEDLDLRGVVCDTMGKIASAVGAEAFKPYVQPLMQASEEALHLDHPRLRETSYILWSTLAKVYEEDFAPFLDGAVKGLHDCMKQDETDSAVSLGEQAKDLLGQEVIVAGQKVKVAEASDDDDLEDMDDDDDWDDLSAVTAVAMEKEIAAEVIGDIVTHVRRIFLPYVQDTVQIVLELMDHSYEGCRKAAIGTLWRTYACIWGMAEGDGMEHWQPGLPLKVQPTEDLVKLGDILMTKTITAWEEELDRGTATDIHRDLAASFKLCGPAVLVTSNGIVVPKVCEQLLAVITRRHPCQQDIGDDGDDGEELEESSEYDWLVIDTALDCLACLASAIGPNFGELWKMFEKPILRFCSSQEATERTTAVGAIAETVVGMGEGVTPYTSSLMKVLLHRLGDEDPECKSNAAFAIGVLAENSQDDAEVLKNLQPIFVKLEPMLDQEGVARMRDNAAGCISRIISRFPDRIPLEEVLPRLIAVLPLKEDYKENTPVYEMIIKLYQAKNAIIQQLTPSLLHIFPKVLDPPEEQLEEDTRAKLMDLVTYLHK
ncbi:ARM repeat-containing protein [Pseudovirgaria hyperparasitica]|uniref:ARM repeat-containing protein n=1 Tax=Pseudovirgaria hyperparasitica TaxID=470096 RepID=A0A6A6WC89_9PEZI|nr:ARM repeat-containing protein [Pseudovirgaria hyperparasitica]KAF2760448.1 ARM repeat-containing protein [Pseudovirgaria hyperparasitica]